MGLPLAPPSRRLAAMLVDLLLVAILVNLGGVLLAVAAAFVAFRLAARLAPKGAGRLAGLARVGIRSFGAIVLFVVALNLWAGVSDEDAGEALREMVEDAEQPWMGAVVNDALESPVPAGVEALTLRTDSLASSYAAALAAGDTGRADQVAPLLAARWRRTRWAAWTSASTTWGTSWPRRGGN